MIFIFYKKKHQTASPENLHFLTKKNRTAFGFYARIRTKTVLESLKDSLQKYGPFFQFSF